MNETMVGLRYNTTSVSYLFGAFGRCSLPCIMIAMWLMEWDDIDGLPIEPFLPFLDNRPWNTKINLEFGACARVEAKYNTRA